MFAEYITLTGFTWEGTFCRDSSETAIFLAIAGVALAVIGFKVKGLPGAIVALLLEAFVLIYLKGLLYL